MSELHDRVERLSPDDLIPYGNNAKEHPDDQVKKIASSIKNYGWDQPIVVDADNEIIKGHGRLKAAELLGLAEVPVIRRDDLTDAEAKAARIADNKAAESPWNDDLLGAEIEFLESSTIDIDTLGFDDDELDDLLDGLADGMPEPADETSLGLDTEFEVIVDCEDESEQERVFNELTQEGYECRINSL